jgi:pilus assembly protein CpaC
MKRSIKIFLAALVICLAAIGMSPLAHSAGGPGTVKLSVGKADTVRVSSSVADVLVANPSIADVGTLRADRLYIVGRSVGDTNVLVFDAAGNQIANIAIQVRSDELTLSEALRQYFPGEQVEVSTVNDSIVMKGRVSTPIVANQIRDLMGRFVKPGQSLVDLMKVGGEQQVMLKVKVLEVSRSTLREFGINSSIGSSGKGKLTGSFTTASGVGLSGVTEFGSGVIGLAGSGALGALTTDFTGVENDGVINTLAEPTLTAISGETAGFLSGGEFPVPVSATLGNVTVDFKQFGVALNFIPTVLDNDRLSLQLTSEVSAISKANSVTLSGTTIPGLTVQRAQTTVQMGSGGTLMIAGLLQSQGSDTYSGFPGLTSLPVLGNLFKSKSFQRGESELVFLVTPYIVQPYADQQAERAVDPMTQAHQIVTATHALSINDLHTPGATLPMTLPQRQGAAAPAAAPASGQSPGQSLPARGGTQGLNGVKPRAPVAAPVTSVAAETLAPSDRAMPPGVAGPAPAGKTAAKPKPIVSSVWAGSPTVNNSGSPTVNNSGSPGGAGAKTGIPSNKAAANSAAVGGSDPLAASFMNNLKNSYGSKAPTAMTPGPAYGYIVD